MPHPLANPFDKRKPPTLTNAEVVEKVSGLAARQAMEELLSHKEAPIEDIEIHMTDEERAVYESELNAKYESKAEKKRKEYIAWAASFGQDEEWVEEIFTFNTDGTVEVEGNLNVWMAITPFPKGLTRVGGYLHLDSLTSAEGLVLPKEVGSSLYLESLTSAEGLTFPEKIGGSLHLDGLTSAKGLVLPREIGGYLSLNGLTSTEGLVLPESFNGYLHASSLSQKEQNKLWRKYPTLNIV